MASATIDNFNDPLIRRVKRLQRDKRYRRKQAAFFVEGVPAIRTALEHDAKIEAILFCDDLLVNDAGRTIVRELGPRRDVPCRAVSEAVFRDVSERNAPEGLGAIAEARRRDLNSLVVGPSDVFVALEGISDPGNLGTILRTLDAAESAGLILVGQCTDPYHPRTVRASRGALFTVPVAHAADAGELFGWASRFGVHTIATSARDGVCLWEAEYELPALVLVGGEHEGLGAETIQACGQLVTIPMGGSASSLNVGVAASLVLYEIRRATAG